MEPTSFEGDVYRHTSPAYSPLSGEGARRQGGRWNPPNSFPVVYTALALPTVDGELARAVRRAGLAGVKLGPRRLATIHVRLSRVLDLTSAANRTALGVTMADLTADDSSRPQRIGATAHQLGFEAVLAPSAAGSGQVLAIFVGELGPSSKADVLAVREGYQPDLGSIAPGEHERPVQRSGELQPRDNSGSDTPTAS